MLALLVDALNMFDNCFQNYVASILMRLASPACNGLAKLRLLSLTRSRDTRHARQINVVSTSFADFCATITSVSILGSA
jgi:hypothetical protein